MPVISPFPGKNGTIDLEKADQLHTDRIKLIVLDVDGVMTDGGMYYDSMGQEQKRFYVKDGLAIAKAISRGMEFGIISAGLRSEVVELRAKMLGIQNVVVSGKIPKIETLDGWLKSKELTYEHVAYIGDDVNDLEIIQRVGLSACPADAAPKVRSAATVQLLKKGGEGCVREFLDTYFTEI